MFHSKNIFVTTIIAAFMFTYTQCSWTPATTHALKASNIEHQIEIEKDIKPSTFKYDNPMAVTLKLKSFEEFVKKERIKNPNTLTTAHINKINDIQDTIQKLVSTAANDSKQGTLDKVGFNLIDLSLIELDTLKENILEQLNSAYDLLRLYNQKTTSVKTRISNAFKKQGTERSTTSSEEKNRLKKLIPGVIGSLVKLQTQCNTMIASLEQDMQQHPRIEQYLLFIEAFIKKVLILSIENGINDLRK